MNIIIPFFEKQLKEEADNHPQNAENRSGGQIRLATSSEKYVYQAGWPPISLNYPAGYLWPSIPMCSIFPQVITNQHQSIIIANCCQYLKKIKKRLSNALSKTTDEFPAKFVDNERWRPDIL